MAIANFMLYSLSFITGFGIVDCVSKWKKFIDHSKIINKLNYKIAKKQRINADYSYRLNRLNERKLKKYRDFDGFYKIYYHLK